MNRFSLAAVALTAVSLTACASLSPYGPQSSPSGQGYSEQRIESNRYQITYRGVGDPRPVADYALLRAADLTIENGNDWFEVTQIRGQAKDGSVEHFQVGMKVGFRLEDD